MNAKVQKNLKPSEVRIGEVRKAAAGPGKDAFNQRHTRAPFLPVLLVVPANVEHRDLLGDALCYRSAAGGDQPARHQVKRSP